MSDLDKLRIQSDARRTAAHRRTPGPSTDQAIIRHLGVELYRERRHSERTKDEPSENDESSKNDRPAD